MHLSKYSFFSSISSNLILGDMNYVRKHQAIIETTADFFVSLYVLNHQVLNHDPRPKGPRGQRNDMAILGYRNTPEKFTTSEGWCQ